ncbi:MAG: hypothetical protein JXA44_06100 [Methanospirillaceae archaeon]|nr:hypothetical protein [Methanospirillaceae archaeon]
MRLGLLVLGIVMLVGGILCLTFSAFFGDVMYALILMAGIPIPTSSPEGESCFLLLQLIGFFSAVLGMVFVVCGIISVPRASSPI